MGGGFRSQKPSPTVFRSLEIRNLTSDSFCRVFVTIIRFIEQRRKYTRCRPQHGANVELAPYSSLHSIPLHSPCILGLTPADPTHLRFFFLSSYYPILTVLVATRTKELSFGRFL